MRETITYTVYNQQSDPVTGVLLTTALEPGVTIAGSSQQPDQNGQKLAWSMGTIQGFARASVSVQGVSTGWVSLQSSVTVGANLTVDVPLVLTSDAFAGGSYSFTVSASGNNGAASSVGASLVLQGQPAVDPDAHGVVVTLIIAGPPPLGSCSSRVSFSVTEAIAATSAFSGRKSSRSNGLTWQERAG